MSTFTNFSVGNVLQSDCSKKKYSTQKKMLFMLKALMKKKDSCYKLGWKQIAILMLFWILFVHTTTSFTLILIRNITNHAAIFLEITKNRFET